MKAKMPCTVTIKSTLVSSIIGKGITRKMMTTRQTAIDRHLLVVRQHLRGEGMTTITMTIKLTMSQLWVPWSPPKKHSMMAISKIQRLVSMRLALVQYPAERMSVRYPGMEMLTLTGLLIRMYLCPKGVLRTELTNMSVRLCGRKPFPVTDHLTQSLPSVDLLHLQVTAYHLPEPPHHLITCSLMRMTGVLNYRNLMTHLPILHKTLEMIQCRGFSCHIYTVSR
mmetsp:Transcript_4844/g.7372  ORF Transcript_4844/g.7372 Transcript_4844/m.7372 type:complete len:224 (-) Transcript_4844:43-714(-)